MFKAGILFVYTMVFSFPSNGRTSPATPHEEDERRGDAEVHEVAEGAGLCFTTPIGVKIPAGKAKRAARYIIDQASFRAPGGGSGRDPPNRGRGHTLA